MDIALAYFEENGKLPQPFELMPYARARGETMNIIKATKVCSIHFKCCCLEISFYEMKMCVKVFSNLKNSKNKVRTFVEKENCLKTVSKIF